MSRARHRLVRTLLRGLGVALLAGLARPAAPASGQARPDSVAPRPDSVAPRPDSVASRPDSAAGPESRPAPRLPDLRVVVRRPAGAVTLHRLERGRADLAGPSVADWVRGLPGVQTRGRGAGGPEILTLRGGRPEDVRVTLDGIPLDDPMTGVADLSLVPGASLESATLRAGAGGTTGAGGTAGTLELRSREVEPGVRVGLGVGSFGRRTAEVEGGWRGGGLHGGLFVYAEGARNDYPFENRIHPRRPEERRVNADRELWSLLARGGLEGAPLTVLVRADGVERGSPGRMGNHVWDEARWRERRTSVGAAWDDPAGPRVSLAWTRRGSRFRDPRSGRSEATVAEQLGFRGAASGPAGVEVGWEAIRARIEGDAFLGARTRWLAGLRLSRTIRLGTGTELQAALGADAAREGPAVSPSLGLAWGRGAWSAWGRLSRARRLPTFADLFLRPGLGVRPDPDLRPERVEVDAEGGVAWRSGRLSGRAAGFWRRTRDPIVWLPSVVAIWSPRNLGRLEAVGLEAGGGWEAAAELLVEASATWQRSTVRLEGATRRPLPYEPAISAGLALTYLTPRRAVRASLDWIGRRRTNLFASHELAPYALLNIRARQAFYIVGVTAEVELGVLNALSSTYERVELFPEPGRRFEAALRLRPGRTALPRRAAGDTLRRRAHAEADTSNRKERS